uniref:Uncharacterized protein n=1 Tax=Siphoviridae sp. ctfYP22 TaxID=2827584 RepID=A0A8S5LJ29_9CAUD|nr:MAG TPA: hypothetical protein [Siphoviridae sp. ctfYP22]
MDSVPFPLTLRAVLLFEKLSARSFSTLNIQDGEQIPLLIYCLQRCEDGGSKMPFDAWVSVLDSVEVSSHLYGRLERTLEELTPITASISDGEDSGEPSDGEDDGPDFTTIANMIIVDGGIDAGYVMDRMELWEIPSILNAIQKRKQEKLEYTRLFTWMSMLPHLAQDSVCSPEKLLPFPWETESEDVGQAIFDQLKDAKIVVADK